MTFLQLNNLPIVKVLKLLKRKTPLEIGFIEGVYCLVRRDKDMAIIDKEYTETLEQLFGYSTILINTFMSIADENYIVEERCLAESETIADYISAWSEAVAYFEYVKNLKGALEATFEKLELKFNSTCGFCDPATLSNIADEFYSSELDDFLNNLEGK